MNPTVRYPILILLILAASTILAIAAPVTNHGVTVTPPSGWDVWATDTDHQIDMRTAAQAPATFLSIKWKPLGEYHCKNLADAGRYFSGSCGGQKPQVEDSTLGGLRALQLSALGEPTCYVHVIAIKQGQLYDLSLICPYARKSEMLPVFKTVLSSVTFK